MSFIKYIANESHYKEVLSLVGKAKQTVWIGTADINRWTTMTFCPHRLYSNISTW